MCCYCILLWIDVHHENFKIYLKFFLLEIYSDENFIFSDAYNSALLSYNIYITIS